MPVIHNLLARWVPKTERSRTLYRGGVTGLGFYSTSSGWPSGFYSFGLLLGALWAVVCSRNVSPSRLQVVFRRRVVTSLTLATLF